MTEVTPVFVYGTLRPGGFNYERLQLWNLVHDFETGVLKHHMMLSNGAFPYIVKGLGNTVIGTLLYPHDEDSACSMLVQMDRIEGTKRGLVHDKNHYNRMLRTIKTPSGKKKAWTYIPPKPRQSSLKGRLDKVYKGDWLLPKETV